MTSLRSKLAAGTVAAVVAVGGGLVVANIGSGEGAASSSRQAQGQVGAPPGGGMTGARTDLSDLASDLGVSEDRLQTAFDDAMQDAGPPTRSTSAAGPDALAATLADELGLSEAKVEAALEANRPSGPAGGGGGGQGAAPPTGQTPPTGSPSGTAGEQSS